MPRVLSSSAARSWAFRRPLATAGKPPTASTWISRKLSGRPMPPVPETLPTWPRPLSPAVRVMLRPVTSTPFRAPEMSRSYASTRMPSSSVSSTPLSSSASRILRGESSRTSAGIGVAQSAAAPLQRPVEWMWPTRRSPLPLCSITQMLPLVRTSILPEPSITPCCAPVSSSVHWPSTSVKALMVMAEAGDGWKTPMLWPALISVKV